MALKRDIRNYFYKYCENGHMLYSSSGPISRKMCSKCGSEFIDSCRNCSSSIPSKFSSPFYFTSGEPINLPHRPDFCNECGEPFPWHKSQKKFEEPNVDLTKVFVVHGRNPLARESMFQFLRAIGLKPIEWSQATTMSGKGAPFISEILEVAFSNAQAVVVLITGDDEAKLRNDYLRNSDPIFEKVFTPQARPNVLFEAGMAFGYHPDRTILVEIGETRPFSDIAGRHIIRINNSSESRQDLAQRLKNAGCVVDISGTDWHNVGDFENCISPYNPTSEPEMEFKPPFYYKTGDKIPHCPICWESNGKQIHLDGPHDIPGEKPFYKCLKCNNNF